MDWSTLFGMLLDVALGGMAYRLARSLERTQIQQTAILTELSRRVERLETREVPTLGFVPSRVPEPA